MKVFKRTHLQDSLAVTRIRLTGELSPDEATEPTVTVYDVPGVTLET